MIQPDGGGDIDMVRMLDDFDYGASDGLGKSEEFDGRIEAESMEAGAIGDPKASVIIGKGELRGSANQTSLSLMEALHLARGIEEQQGIKFLH